MTAFDRTMIVDTVFNAELGRYEVTQPTHKEGGANFGQQANRDRMDALRYTLGVDWGAEQQKAADQVNRARNSYFGL